MTHFFPFDDYDGPQVCVCGRRNCEEAIRQEIKERKQGDAAGA